MVKVKGGNGNDTISVGMGSGLLDELVDDLVAASTIANGPISAEVKFNGPISAKVKFKTTADGGNLQAELDRLDAQLFEEYMLEQAAEEISERLSQETEMLAQTTYDFEEVFQFEASAAFLKTLLTFQDTETETVVAEGLVVGKVITESIEEVEVDVNSSDMTFNFQMNVSLDMVMAYDVGEQKISFEAQDAPPGTPTVFAQANGEPAFPSYWNVGLGSGADLVDLQLDISWAGLSLETRGGADTVTISGVQASVDLGNGNDTFNGGKGKQSVVDGSGEDEVKGGGSLDTFFFVIDGVKDVIKDWQVGEDIVLLIAQAAEEYSLTQKTDSKFKLSYVPDPGGPSETLIIKTKEEDIPIDDLEGYLTFVDELPPSYD